MPKRPAKHQIEDISRAKFQLTLPRTWVFRDVTPDYGIDGEVEVFNEDETSTGLTFLVQLKATENDDVSRRRRVSLTKDQIIYYRKRQPPVLIVRYDHVEDKIFYRWAGQIDLYNAKPTAKTFSFVFGDEEMWRDISPQALVDDLNRSIRLINGQLTFPISVYLLMAPDVTRHYSATMLRSTIGTSMGGNAGNSLQLSLDPDNDFDIKVVLSDAELTVIIGSGTGFTFHNLNLTKNEISMGELARLVIAGVSVSLSHFGQNGLASRVRTH